jgi:DNA-binding HxlR family transcriptional regulator
MTSSRVALKSLLVALHFDEATDTKREAVAASADIIGAKWTSLLIYDLGKGKRRFRELEHSCEGISSRTLAERLRALEKGGIVRRHSYPESPPRVEYELTDKGRDLLPVIEAMTAYGRSWLVPGAPQATPASAGSLPAAD